MIPRKLLVLTLALAGAFCAGAQDISNSETENPDEDNNTSWLIAPTIVVEGNSVWVEGDGAEYWNAIYANDEKLRISKGVASIENVEGNIINLRATMSNGVILIRKYKR